MEPPRTLPPHIFKAPQPTHHANLEPSALLGNLKPSTLCSYLKFCAHKVETIETVFECIRSARSGRVVRAGSHQVLPCRELLSKFLFQRLKHYALVDSGTEITFSSFFICFPRHLDTRHGVIDWFRPVSHPSAIVKVPPPLGQHRSRQASAELGVGKPQRQFRGKAGLRGQQSGERQCANGSSRLGYVEIRGHRAWRHVCERSGRAPEA